MLQTSRTAKWEQRFAQKGPRDLTLHKIQLLICYVTRFAQEAKDTHIDERYQRQDC